MIIPVGKHDLYDACLDDEQLGAGLADFEQSLALLVKLLLRPVEQLSQDVLISIA
jgi:hypothetical protein